MKAAAIVAGVGAILALTFLLGFCQGYEALNRKVSWDGDYPTLRPVKEFSI